MIQIVLYVFPPLFPLCPGVAIAVWAATKSVKSRVLGSIHRWAKLKLISHQHLFVPPLNLSVSHTLPSVTLVSSLSESGLALVPLLQSLQSAPL